MIKKIKWQIYYRFILPFYSPSLSFESHFSFFLLFLLLPPRLPFPLHFTIKDFQEVKFCETKFIHICSCGKLNPRKTCMSFKYFTRACRYHFLMYLSLWCHNVRPWRFLIAGILPVYPTTVWQLVVAGGLTNGRCLRLTEEIMLESLGLLFREFITFTEVNRMYLLPKQLILPTAQHE